MDLGCGDVLSGVVAHTDAGATPDPAFTDAPPPGWARLIHGRGERRGSEKMPFDAGKAQVHILDFGFQFVKTRWNAPKANDRKAYTHKRSNPDPESEAFLHGFPRVWYAEL